MVHTLCNTDNTYLLDRYVQFCNISLNLLYLDVKAAAFPFIRKMCMRLTDYTTAQEE